MFIHLFTIAFVTKQVGYKIIKQKRPYMPELLKQVAIKEMIRMFYNLKLYKLVTTVTALLCW